MGSDGLDVNNVLVAYGDACATLTPRMKEALRAAESGTVLEVRTDDPSAREAVPAWCRLTGHGLIEVREEDELRTRFFVRKK